MAIDTLNQEKRNAKRGIGSRLSEGLRNLPGIRQIRNFIGGQANTQANASIYTMEQQGAGYQAPNLVGEFGKNKENREAFLKPENQLQPSTVGTENGWHLKAKSGNPTIVYFGGSEFDRDTYKGSIKEMAEMARDQGLGFAVFDYPANANEETIKAHVDNIMSHLEQQGVPKNQQAYSGFSLGGFPAMYAAKQNPEAAGLHVISTFSSVRQATKEGMKEELGIAASLIPKHQLTEIMDNVGLADQIVADQTQRTQQGQKPMPVSMVSNKNESFGENQNRHMTPLKQRFDTYPDQAKLNFKERTDLIGGPKKNEHLLMQNTDEHKSSFKTFVSQSKAYSQERGLGVQQPQVDAQQPQVDTQQPQVDVQQPKVKSQQPKVEPDSQQPDVETVARPKSVRETLTGSNLQKPGSINQTQELDPASLSVKDKIPKLENGKVGDSIQRQAEVGDKQPKVGVKL